MCDELAGDIVTAGAFAHPAFLREHHFYNLKSNCTVQIWLSGFCFSDVTTEPLFLSCSEIDHTFDTDSRNKAIDILQNEKKCFQLQLFSGVEHGFALRGNMEDPYERRSPFAEVPSPCNC